MKTIDEITLEFCGAEPPKPIHALNDDISAVAQMKKLVKILKYDEEDLLELSACAGVGVVACWHNNYRFCRDGGIPPFKMYQDGALLAAMSEEGQIIKAWAEENLSKVLADVDACESEEEGAKLWIAYCAAAYRYGMAIEQQIMDIESA